MSLMGPLQTALVARLAATAGVTALVGTRVYDGMAPEGAVLPYIVIGEQSQADASPLGTYGYRNGVTLHLWSAYNGISQVSDVLEAVTAALREPLTIAGHTAARLEPMDAGPMLIEEEGDSKFRHLPVRCRVFTFATA